VRHVLEIRGAMRVAIRHALYRWTFDGYLLARQEQGQGQGQGGRGDSTVRNDARQSQDQEQEQEQEQEQGQGQGQGGINEALFRHMLDGYWQAREDHRVDGDGPIFDLWALWRSLDYVIDNAGRAGPDPTDPGTILDAAAWARTLMAR
jgi:hypothetical protein